MIKYLGALVVVGGICLGSVTAHAAEITTGEFLAEYKSGSPAARKDWEETLAAVQQGMAVANVALVHGVTQTHPEMGNGSCDNRGSAARNRWVRSSKASAQLSAARTADQIPGNPKPKIVNPAASHNICDQTHDAPV
jgi:hypothetical protein